MSSVHEAAERLRRHKDAMDSGKHADSPYWQPKADRGYLSQLDEDRERLAYFAQGLLDSEPITEEWLRQVGFSDGYCDGYDCLFYGAVNITDKIGGDWRVYIGEWFEYLPNPTRGTVRHLVGLFGMALKEARP